MLLERLVGYTWRVHPNEDFDAIISQMLLNFLLEKEVICFDAKGRLALQDDEDNRSTVYMALREFQKKFEERENGISSSLDLNIPADMEKAKDRIKYFVRYWACRHEKRNPEYLGIAKGDYSDADYEKAYSERIKRGNFKYKEDYTLHPFDIEMRRILNENGVKSIYNYTNTRTVGEPYRPASKVSVDDLVLDDLAIYGDRFAYAKPDASNAREVNQDLLAYMSSLAEKMEKGESVQLANPGDILLIRLAAADWDRVENELIDSKLVALVSQKNLNENERYEVACLIREQYEQSFDMKAFDERFLSRVLRIIKAKIEHRNQLGQEVSHDGRRSTVGAHTLEEFIANGRRELIPWRKSRMKLGDNEMNNSRRITGAGVLTIMLMALGAGLLTSGSSKTPDSNISTKGTKIDNDRNANMIAISQPLEHTLEASEQPVKAEEQDIPKVQPKQSVSEATPRPIINSAPRKLASITIGPDNKLEFDYSQFQAPTNTDDKVQIAIKEFLQELLPRILKRAENQEMLLPAKPIEFVNYSVMSPNSPLVGINKIQVMGFSFGQLNMRIASESIYEIVNGKTTAKDLAASVEITSPDFNNRN